MTQETLEDLYNLHQKYVNSIQRLPLSPYVLNIDKTRDEDTTNGEICRDYLKNGHNHLLTQTANPSNVMREWAAGTRKHTCWYRNI
jgi:hypothetical protein